MKPPLLLLSTILLGAISFAAAAQAEESDRITSPRCLSLSHVRSIDIIDKETLVFRMRQKRMYLNVLRHRCPGLERDSTLLYRPTSNQLCDLDSITVLHTFGNGFMPGASCGLGKFSLLSEDQVKSLKAAREK